MSRSSASEPCGSFCERPQVPLVRSSSGPPITPTPNVFGRQQAVTSLIVLLLLTALSCGLAPATALAGTAEEINSLPVLDPLNRVESPLSNGGKWSALAWATNSSGHATGRDTETGWGPYDTFATGANGAYWNPATFSDTSGSAAAITIQTAPGNERYVSLWLDMANPGSTKSGYQLRWRGLSTAKTYKVTLSNWSSGTETVLAEQASVEIATGTTMAISDTGSTVTAWKGTGGSLSSILSASDSAFSSGYAGMEGSGNLTRSKDFKAGAFVPKNPPDTTITGGSTGKVTPDVSFTFNSSGEASSFECALDAGSYGACSSPKSYEGLAEGSHTFKVRAVGPGGADPTPAERTVEVRELAKAVSSVSILDDFGRQEVPLKGSKWSKTSWAEEIGGSWTNPWHGYGANGNHLASAYWNPTTFSDASDGLLISAILGTGPIYSGEYLSLWLDMPNPGSARSGYEARFTGTNNTSSGYKVELSKWASGERTVLAKTEGFTLSKGTTFTLTETGGRLTIWTGTTSFSRVLTAYDATYSSGYAGIEANKGEGTAYDFRAGSMTPPSKPSVTSVIPGSPANNNSPSLVGSATAGSTVQLFTNSSCSGSPVASGSATAFGSTGIAASVADNSTTIFYANATNAAGSSPCSTTSVTYVEDSIAPEAPTVNSTSPASGSNDNAPKAIGSAESSSTVKLYTNATCTSAVAATGTAAAFASPGLTVSVADNTTTTFYATATDAAGNVSACSSTSVTYVEATTKVYWGAWLGGNAYSTGEKTYGDGPWDSETWNLFEKHAGKKISIEHFGQPAPWNQAFAEGPLNLTRERGAIPMMDMDPDGVTLKAIVEGKKDSDFKTWAKAVKAWGYPMFFRWTWEMNGTWFQWGEEAAANPALYKEAWWHLHDIVEEQGASNVTWVWCPNLTFSGSTSLSSLYPAKESEGKGKYVDWTCLDGYNFGKNPKKPDSWKSFSTLYTSSYNELLSLAPTKPIMIGEMSSTEYGGSKASWITDAIGTQIPENFPKIKAVVWYNKWDGELDWPIETSSSSESAFASAIASTYYAGNTFGSLPALTKVEPLP